MAPHELGAILLSSSFLAALIVGGIAGRLGGMMTGFGAGAMAISLMSLAAAWITWQSGDQPDSGMVRVTGTVAMPADPDPGRPAGEPITNHDFVIQYADKNGKQHQIWAAYVPTPLDVGQRVAIDYPASAPERGGVADPGRNRTLLMAFLLFGAIPFAMSLAMFATAWEGRPGAAWTPAPRSPAVLKACSWARVPATIVFIAGFVVTFRESSIESIGAGFPLVGAGAFAHAVIGVVEGIRWSGVLIYVVVGVGFVGFGFFARLVSGTL